MVTRTGFTVPGGVLDLLAEVSRFTCVTRGESCTSIGISAYRSRKTEYISLNNTDHFRTGGERLSYYWWWGKLFWSMGVFNTVT